MSRLSFTVLLFATQDLLVCGLYVKKSFIYDHVRNIKAHNLISLFVFGHSYNACVYDWMIISCLRIFQPYKDATFDCEGLQSLDLNFRLYGLWSGRDLYHATLAVTCGFGFCSLMQKTTLLSRLLQQRKGTEDLF